MSHRTISNHNYHFPHFILFISSSFGIFRCIEPRRDCTSFHGKKGLKTQRFVIGKNIKSNHKPSICSPRDPKDNEMYLIRNEWDS
jgi:hypothetical protein